MYNLTVDTAHTFFVREGQWLVHNCGDDDFITLYHRSFNNATNIYKKGLDVNKSGTAYVTDSFEAAKDAIDYRKIIFAMK